MGKTGGACPFQAGCRLTGPVAMRRVVAGAVRAGNLAVVWDHQRVPWVGVKRPIATRHPCQYPSDLAFRDLLDGALTPNV